MVPVARRNLLAEKGRLLVSVLGVGFAVLLVLVVLALYRGFGRTGETFELLPGDLWLAQQGTTDPFHSLSLVQSSELSTLGLVPGVAAVAPVLIRQMSFAAGGREVSARVIAIEVPREVEIDAKLKARYFPPAGMMVIDKILASKENLHQGQTVDLNGVELTIGKVQPRSAEAFQPFAFVNYADAERIFGVRGVFNFGMVMTQPGYDVGEVSQSISETAPGVQAFTKEQFAKAIRKEIDDSFLPIIGIILGIGFAVGGAVVGLTLYTATIEHAREFAVMKAVGASGAFLYRIVASQSVMLTAAGFLVGLVGALVVSRMATSAVPDFSTEFRVGDILGVFLVTALMAFTASLLPARRINGIDPALVFKA